MIRRHQIIPAALLCLFVLTGCGIQGSWIMRDIKPPEARKYFNLAKATFNEDMTFEAVTVKDGQKSTSKGTYKYDNWTRKLTLYTNDKELEYSAIPWWIDMLRVEKKMPDGGKVTMTMTKPENIKRCPKCGAIIE